MSAYLSSIHVQNFKSLIGPADIELTPLTFFYGPNSAGKSAVGAAIDLLLQFCEAGEPVNFNKLRSLVRNQDPNNLLSLGATASYVDFPFCGRFNDQELSSFSNNLANTCPELLFYFRRENFNDETRKEIPDYTAPLDVSIRFEIETKRQENSSMSWSSLTASMARKLEHLNLEACPGTDGFYWATEIKIGHEVLLIMTWEFMAFNLDHEVFGVIDRMLAYDDVSFAELFERFFFSHRIGSFLGSGPEHIFRDGFLDIGNNDAHDFDTSRDLSGPALWSLVKDLTRFLVMIPMHICASAARSTVHVGPIRHIPAPRELTFLERGSKVYATTESSNPSWHWYNGNAAWKTIASSLSEDNQLLSNINGWLISPQRLGLRHGVFVAVYETCEVAVQDDAENRLLGVVESIPERLIVVRLRDEVLRMPVDVRDVGAGVPQIVPVLVAGLCANCSFIEQPELHLHPRLQTEIADFFISVTNTRGHRCIIETHSEHLALRTLRRVRETHAAHIRHRDFSLEKESVAFYYFNPIEGGTEISRLRVSPTGDFLDRWPRGFFSEREAEIFDDDD